MNNLGQSDNQQPLLEETAHVSRIYKIKPEELKKLFDGVKDDNNEPNFDYMEQLRVHGGVQGILKKLASEKNTGIVGDEKDLKRRKRVFGTNQRPAPPKANIVESIKQTLREVLWVIIGGTAFLSTLCCFIIGKWKEGAEGLSIIVMSLVLIAVTSISDYVKDKKYIELSNLVKEEKIPVIRGKLGASQSVSVWDIVVGDVILLNTGEMVPADCLVIDSFELKVDIPDQKTRDFADLGVAKSREDPLLVAGSLISRGECRALVCCVGEFSTRGVTEPKLETDENTPLQNKLQNLTMQFTKMALIACIVILLLSIGMIIVQMTTGVWWKVLLTKSMKLINLIVVLFVVILPEGLPLTVGVSLAFTTSRMYKKDRILVRKLEAPEIMGSVNELLVGKTNTITTGQMKMSQFLCEDKQIKNTRKNTLLHCELSDQTLELIKESILFNCSARIEMDATTYVPVGDATEVGLLKFLQDADIPIHLLIQQKYGRIKSTSPFSSIKKRSASAIEHPTQPGKVVIYIKGAPEVIIDMCQYIQGSQGIQQLNPDLTVEIRKEVSSMASKPLRVIAFAYHIMDLDEWNQGFGEAAKIFEQALDDKHINFTFLGAFGLKDSLRPNVKSAIKYVKDKGHLQIRMISGDHIETAKKIAYKAGILNDEDLDKENAIMDAEDFRTAVEGIIEKQDDGDDEEKVKLSLSNQENFQMIIPELKVLARANAHDKLLMVVGLQEMGQIVAATGEGINDIDALKNSDVGLAMGSGCAAAKLASDLILTDNDFESSIRAIMWGRNIHHNVSRFLQFQVTTNISAMLIIFVGLIFFAESPLNAVQLLWINLIMDTFAAIALSTEPPLEKILKQNPTSKSSLMSAAVWRQILGVSLWNFVLILILFIFGKYIGDLENFSNYQEVNMKSPKDYCDADDLTEIKKKPEQVKVCQAYWGSLEKRKLFTYIFCTFVYLQVFNYINCRKIGLRELNVFERIHHNIYFILIFAITFVGQILMVQWFGGITRTTALTRSEWGACITTGATVLFFAWAIKFTPKGLLKKIPFTKFVDEDATTKDKFADMALALNDQKINVPALPNKTKDNDYQALDNDTEPHQSEA